MTKRSKFVKTKDTHVLKRGSLESLKIPIIILVAND